MHPAREANIVGNDNVSAHPNCILFITQGGVLSVTEAAYYGVPIVGIPVFGDQFANIRRTVENGFAKRIHLSARMAEDIRNAIGEMLRNSRCLLNLTL